MPSSSAVVDIAGVHKIVARLEDAFVDMLDILSVSSHNCQRFSAGIVVDAQRLATCDVFNTMEKMQTILLYLDLRFDYCYFIFYFKSA